MASVKGALGVILAASMFASSTAASAAGFENPVQLNPWAALSAMSAGAPAATMCGAAAAAAAAQAPGGCVLPALDAPPPVAQVNQPLPPVAAAPVAVAAAGSASAIPLLVALALLAAAAGAYGLSKSNGGIGPIPTPNSPA